MAKKDFTVNAQIAEATATGRKPRKETTPEEAAQYMADMKTAGHKGAKLPRINMAFTPENYEYIKIMSRVSGQTYTEFVNQLLDTHKKEHWETYARALEFRNNL